MKELHEKVNIVPVIGKADTLTKSELASMKARVRSLLLYTSLSMRYHIEYLQLNCFSGRDDSIYNPKAGIIFIFSITL